MPNKTITRKPGYKAWFNEECRRVATKKRSLYHKMWSSNDPAAQWKFLEARVAISQVEGQAKTQYNNKLKKDLSDKSVGSKKWVGNCKFSLDVDVQASLPLNIRASPMSQQIKKQTSSVRPLRRSADCLMLLLIISCSAHCHHSPLAISTSSPELSGTSYATWIQEGHQGLMKFQRGLLKSVLRSWPVLSAISSNCFSLMACSLNTGKLPVILVHKRDSKSDPSKYRPLSLLTMISKVMESAVHRQLLAYLLHHNLISNKQYRFRLNLRTADLLTVLSQTWNNIQDKGDEVCIVELDIKGAFDQVWHNGLCVKLMTKDITGQLYTWLQNYLQGRSIKVVLSGQSSLPCPIILVGGFGSVHRQQTHKDQPSVPHLRACRTALWSTVQAGQQT